MTSGNRPRRVSVLERTRAQRLAALELANETRFARARLKKAIAAGGVCPIATVRQPPGFALTMKVTQLLEAIPGNGPVKTRKIMRKAAVSDAKTLGGISDRQRDDLADLIGAPR